MESPLVRPPPVVPPTARPHPGAVSWRARLQAVLLPVEDRATQAALWVSRVAIVVLIASGETLRWVDYRDTLLSVPTLRATHALAGFALGAALLTRVLDVVLQRLVVIAGRGRVLPPRRTFKPEERSATNRALDTAWWIVVLLLVATGLERYAQLRYGAGMLPLLPSTAWWALHRPLLPYLYSVLLLIIAIRGRMTFRRALSYLYTP